LFLFILWASIIFCGVSYEEKMKSYSAASFYRENFLCERKIVWKTHKKEKSNNKNQSENYNKDSFILLSCCEIKENYKKKSFGG